MEETERIIAIIGNMIFDISDKSRFFEDTLGKIGINPIIDTTGLKDPKILSILSAYNNKVNLTFTVQETSKQLGELYKTFSTM